MKLHDFVFSDKLTLRISRHLLFWLLWWLYFTGTYYYYQQVGLQKIIFGSVGIGLLINSFLLVIIHLLACYAFINFFLPRCLLTARYIEFVAGLVLLSGFLLMASYFLHAMVLPHIDALFYNRPAANESNIWWKSINTGLLNAPKLIAAATAIKLVKRWHLKQKEAERLEKEKLITDLQLLKAQINPGFLFSTLDQIYSCAKKNSPEAPELIIKLSDLLSYMLYECEESKVPLEKELTMMKDYMALEKAKFDNGLEMGIGIKGNRDKLLIAPFLLFPFIENSFKHCSNQLEQPWINLQISIEKDGLTMKLMNGVGLSDVNSDKLPDSILSVQKRLQLLYPGKHELKIYTELEIYVVLLKIKLDEPVYETAFAGVSNSGKLMTMYAIK